MPTPIRALMVENAADDAELIADALRRGGIELGFHRVESEQEMREALDRGGWDIIFLDYVLPGFSGAKALKICKELHCEAPVIVVSGSVGEQLAVQMMKDGADDYVMKDNLARLPAAVERSISDAKARRESRRAQQELRANREWLYAALRSVGEAVIAIDGQGRIEFLNPIAEDLIGYPGAAALGQEFESVVHLLGSGGEPITQPLSRLAMRDQAKDREDLSLISATGKSTSVSMTAAPIRNDAGITIGAVLALRDITDRKQAEEQLRQSNDELHQLMHSVSHDLQEPLRMIAIYADLINRKFAGSDSDMKEFLRYMMNGAKRMSSLLSDLRAYADSTRMDSAPAENVDAEMVLQEVCVNLVELIENSGAMIAHDPLPVLPVHHSHLTQLFQNLISNAIKYRRDDPPTIRMGATRVADQWQFAVSDNGIGIQPQYSERVFDFFKRLHGAEIPGTGMGLAICRRIVQRYGGRIWLESTPGVGTTFYFTLPCTTTPKGDTSSSRLAYRSPRSPHSEIHARD